MKSDIVQVEAHNTGEAQHTKYKISTHMTFNVKRVYITLPKETCNMQVNLEIIRNKFPSLIFFKVSVSPRVSISVEI
jgi:hypothetical protein